MTRSPRRQRTPPISRGTQDSLPFDDPTLFNGITLSAPEPEAPIDEPAGDQSAVHAHEPAGADGAARGPQSPAGSARINTSPAGGTPRTPSVTADAPSSNSQTGRTPRTATPARRTATPTRRAAIPANRARYLVGHSNDAHSAPRPSATANLAPADRAPALGLQGLAMATLEDLNAAGDLPMTQAPWDVLKAMVTFIPPMMQYIPKNATATAAILSYKYLHASLQSEECAVKELMFKKFLLLPMYILASRVEDESKKKGRTSCATRADLLIKDEGAWDALTFNSLVKTTTTHETEDPSNNEAEKEYHIKGVLVSRAQLKAWKLLAEGQASRAMQALLASKVAPQNDETHAALAAKYPAPPAHDNCPSQEEIATTVNVSKEYVKVQTVSTDPAKLIYMCRKKGKLVNPGLFNFRNEYLVQMFKEDTAGGAFAKEVAVLTDKIIAAKLPAPIMDVFKAALVIALWKSGGDVRPIVKINNFRKLAGTVFLQANEHNFLEIFGTEQLGIGVRGAADIIVRGMDAMHQARGARYGDDLATFDAANGYGNANRRVIRSMLELYFPAGLPMFDTFYAEDITVTYVCGASIRSIAVREGVVQGCTLAGFMYCLITVPLIRSFTRPVTPHLASAEPPNATTADAVPASEGAAPDPRTQTGAAAAPQSEDAPPTGATAVAPSVEGAMPDHPIEADAARTEAPSLPPSAEPPARVGQVITAYLDDLSAHGSSADTAALCQHLRLEGPRYGYYLKPQKTRILLGNNHDRETKTRLYCNMLGITIEQCNELRIVVAPADRAEYGTALMGIPLGSEEYIERWLTDKFQDLKTETNIILDFPDTQKRWNLAIASLKAKANHIYRALPYHLVDGFRRQVNQLLTHVYAKCCGHSIEELQRLPNFKTIMDQLEAPLRFGGFDLTCSANRADAAYVGAIASVYSAVMSMFTKRGVLLIVDPRNQTDVEDAVSRLGAAANIEHYRLQDILDLGKDVIQEGKYQRYLAQLTHRVRYETLVASVTADSKEERLHYKQLHGPASGLFLRARAGGGTAMSSQEFEIALSRRGNLPLKTISTSARCICDANRLIDQHGCHLIRCKLKNTWQTRHDKCVLEFVHLMRKSAHITVMNPIGDFNDPNTAARNDRDGDMTNGHSRKQRGLQADIRMDNVGVLKHIKPTAATQHVLFDVVITDDDMMEKERGKLLKYGDAAKHNNLCFIPLAFNTHGNWTAKVDAVIKGLCNKIFQDAGGTDTTSHTYINLLNYWRTRMCVKLHCSVAYQLRSRYIYLVNARVNSESAPTPDNDSDSCDNTPVESH